jgi:diguanylate cyclase (GGDEF)-like protein
VVCRLGGEEFTVIAEGFDDAADVARMCERILGALRQPIACGARRVRIDGSIGVCVHDGSGDVDTAVQRADEAMYASKRAGKGRWKRWTSAAAQRLEASPA